MKIEEIAKMWKEEHFRYIKQSSAAAYSLILRNHVLPRFGSYENIEEKDVQEFINQRISAGASVHAIRDTIIVIKMILRYGAKHHFCYAPIDWKFNFPTRTKDSKKLPCWELPQQRKMIDYLKKHFTFKNLGILIAMETGMRIGEISGLRWGDFDLQTKIVHVQRIVSRVYFYDEEKGTAKTEIVVGSTKTISSNREIPLSKDLLKFVTPLLKICEIDNYVTSNAPAPCEPRTYRNYFNAVCKEVGVPRIKFHGLRHTFATSLIASKCDIKTVSTILGHADISTTLNTYVHPNLEEKSKAINAMLKRLNRC